MMYVTEKAREREKEDKEKKTGEYPNEKTFDQR
jgi:hypothetical protein